MSVRYALLGLLAQRPRHGYELRAALEALVGGKETWEVRPGQVYATLGRLAEAGLVTQVAVEKEGGPEKRVYALAPRGQEALQQWLRSEASIEHQRDEFFIKLMVAVMTGRDDIPQMIQVQRNALFQALHRVTQQRMEADPERELAQILLLDKVMMHLEADLRWLDMVEARLEEVRKQPPPEPAVRPRGRPRKLRG
ncbi:MAG: PadR family transcriptional regulator [Chloroflexia bacterium]